MYPLISKSAKLGCCGAIAVHDKTTPKFGSNEAAKSELTCDGFAFLPTTSKAVLVKGELDFLPDALMLLTSKSKNDLPLELLTAISSIVKLGFCTCTV